MTVAKSNITEPLTLTDNTQKLLNRLEGRSPEDILFTEALRIVRSVWPKAFSVIAPKPLKVHIHKEMESAQLLPSHIISKALKFFTTQDRYLAAIKPGARRVDLFGKSAGTVRLREAVDAEIKRYNLSHPHTEQRERIIIKQIRLVSVKKAS
ncbi:hypothetical protein ACH42_03805 [Endozoicomonas sp. (ex Bugula neritina AB1)]|nr:hypothetical protein ACH42_03805 [Endozoicomonas sp. (ex Bugula neritina AB1)]